jgi:outer membrane protein
MKRTCLISVLLIIFNGYAMAAPSIHRLTLKEAISMALENNNLVKAAGFRAQAAQQGIALTGARYYPHLVFEEAFSASNSPAQSFIMKLDEGRFTQNDFNISNLNHPNTWHDFKTALTLQQTLYDPSLSPARDMAAKEAEKGQLSVETVKEEVAFLVLRLYLDVQRSEAQLKAAEKAVAEAQEHRRLASVRTKAGTGLRSDELRARTHLSSAEQQLITALNDQILAKMQLAITVGLKDGEKADIAEALTRLSRPPQPDELTKTALENRSDLHQSRIELEKGDASVKLARSGYFPEIDGFASYRLNAKDVPFGSDNDAWIAGVNLKWHIFDGFRTGLERDRAAAGRSAAAQMLEGKTKEIRFQVQESFLRREEMGKRLEVARHALLDAEETVRLLSRRFENSLATMVELLDAQTTLNQARANLADTEANYLLAGGRVYYAAGIFMKEMLK